MSYKIEVSYYPDYLLDRKDGNSFNSGPAPPPPPGTPPASKSSPKHKDSGHTHESPSSSGGGSKSGIGGGGIAGILISIIVVGAIIAFFLVKRRSKRASLDIEKLDNQPFAPLASKEVQGNNTLPTSSGFMLCFIFLKIYILPSIELLPLMICLLPFGELTFELFIF